MTDSPSPHPRPHPPPPPPTPRPRRSGSGSAAALMIVIGIVLLLPGVCVVGLAVDNPKLVWRDPIGLLTCMASVAVGVALLWAAFRGPSR
jgi:hypothetical protein